MAVTYVRHNGREGRDALEQRYVTSSSPPTSAIPTPLGLWGGVENLNGLLRQYLPKGADLSRLTEDYLTAIQERLNNRPRKSLNYLSPNQALARELGH